MEHDPMRGHDLTLHETNSGGVVALCACGWTGLVRKGTRNADTRLWPADILRSASLSSAAADHRDHCADVRRHERKAVVEKWAPIVRRPGRFSHS